MDEPRFAQPIPNVTVAVGRDANLPCVVEHLGAYKVNRFRLLFQISFFHADNMAANAHSCMPKRRVWATRACYDKSDDENLQHDDRS